MAWQSPYREAPSVLSPRAREWISRGTLGGVGIVLIYAGLHEMRAIERIDAQATQAVPSSFPWLMLAVAIAGLTMVIAAVLPVRVMQTLFEQFNAPPVSGDRDPGLGDDYRSVYDPANRLNDD